MVSIWYRMVVGSTLKVHGVQEVQRPSPADAQKACQAGRSVELEALRLI